MKKQLTPAEVADVALATKSESYDHCRWPEEVVRAFASAEVITTKGPRRQETGRARPVFGNLARLLRHG
jgi:hypothetical protein